MIRPFKRYSALASATLAFALNACGAQPVLVGSPTAAPVAASPTGQPIVATEAQPAAPTAYPAPGSSDQPAALTAYPAPSVPAAYPAPPSPAATSVAATPPLATPPPEGQAPTLATGAVASCLPPDYPIVPANTPLPARTATPSVQPPSPTPQSVLPRDGYRVVNAYPHDRGAFTEGLQYVDGALYEGTGEYGKSQLRRVALESGEVQQSCSLPEAYFGEGITVLGDTIYQLTWQNHVGFVYDRSSFMAQRTFTYPSEGWGMTYDGQQLIMSDGTSTLHFLDPGTLEETGHIDVYDDRGPLVRLNELEYVRGEIYANVWQTNLIARIDPKNGQVVGWIDLSGLLSPQDRQPKVDVLNGIAYDAVGDRLFVTGKLWPKLFQIEIVPGS